VKTFAGGKIEAYAGPDDLGGPDDLEAAIVDFISKATKTLDIAVQELDSDRIAEAIIERKRAGVSVKIMLNRSYLQEDLSEHPLDPSLTTVSQLALDDGGEYENNRKIFAALCRCGVEVRIDTNVDDKIFHHKFVLRDVRRDKAGGMQRGKEPALLTGSANFTETDCHTNLNNLFVFRNAGLEEDFAEEFQEAWKGEVGRGLLGDPPVTRDLGGVPVKVLFSPDHGPENEVVKQMLKCPKGGTIDFAMFTFMGSSAIDDAMNVLAGADRNVRGVLDRGQAASKYAASKWLQESGVEVLVPRKKSESGVAKLHHKLAVVGGRTVIGGSFNYTQPATLYNDEALLVLGSPYEKEEDVEVDGDECAALAEFFSEEIERIRGLSEPWTPPA
jgi:phosphatidylserine/phosphatidylglycerophosphate/cardiolipin synthase-like enzyme